MKLGQPFLSVNNITVRQGDKFFFEHTSWNLLTGEQWLIYGPNGSGKSLFAKAISGLLPTKQGEIICHFSKKMYLYPQVHKDVIHFVSFETQNSYIQKDEEQKDLYSLVGKEKKGKSVKDFLGNISISRSLFNNLSIKKLLTKKMLSLSTGELRKVFILKALVGNPKLLVLDEPFDGLDVSSKVILMDLINKLMNKLQVVLIVHKCDEIPRKITHILLTSNCSLLAQGEKEKIMNKYPELFQDDLKESINTVLFQRQNLDAGEILVHMRNVIVTFGSEKILNNINWTMKKGENWVILGPNGAGKSTLIQLITGEQLQGYANTIILFGKNIAEGIPLELIRQNIGIVPSNIMMKYDKKITALEVVLSGFFDSIGLYKHTSHKQKKQAHRWLKHFNLDELCEKEFHELSYGQRQLVLIIRSLIKKPKLLILDEPCNGLDSINRKKVLTCINEIGNLLDTNIILITHNKEEIVSCINHIMRLENGKIMETNVRNFD